MQTERSRPGDALSNASLSMVSLVQAEGGEHEHRAAMRSTAADHVLSEKLGLPAREG